MSLRILVSGLLFAIISLSSPLSAADIPEPLQAWQDWVLSDAEAEELCPQLQNEFRMCSWADNLNLELNDNGANFSQNWTILADTWVPLPGDHNHWPRFVSSNGAAIQVLSRDIDGRSRPALLLNKGSHQVTGQFEWSKLPNSLAVPGRSALIDLSINNKNLKEVYTENGELWLGERQEKEKDKLFANVYRKFIDGLPFKMEVILMISASGQSRELTVNNLLLDNFELMHVNSDLPFKQAADGALSLQVHPGDWEIKLQTRALTPPQKIQVEPISIFASNNPAEVALELKDEVWSYQDAPGLRNTQAQGLNLVDPNQSDVPDAWSQLPAYIARAGQSLELIEKRRGISQQPNQLQLERDLWLDFSNQGYTFRDRLSGAMHSIWRLDLQQPFELQSASSNGEQSLVTQIAASTANGIEVRKQSIAVTASGQVAKHANLPISGWSNDMQHVNIKLHLPPGYRLFATTGSDKTYGSWLSKWELWDIFFLLFVTVAFARLVNPKWGVLAFFMLLLTYHELNAPKWLWLNLALALTFVNISSKTKVAAWAKGYQALSIGLLVLISIPFFGQQARTIIYPQLENTGSYGTTYNTNFIESDQSNLESQVEASSAPSKMRRELREVVVTGSRISKQNKIERYDPKALIQTGPGIPTWNWRTYRMQWTGPVSAEQNFKPIILNPLLSRLWLLVGVALIFILLARLAKQGYQEINQTEFVKNLRTQKSNHTEHSQQGYSKISMLISLLVLASISISSPNLHADIPSNEMLQELKTRLLKPPVCQPNCSDLHRAKLEIANDQLSLELEYHLLDRTPVALPGKRGQWLVENIRDAQGNSVPSYSNERTWVLLDKGIQTLKLSSDLSQADAAQIQFTQRPRHVDVQNQEWDVNGVKAGILLSDSIQLLRRAPASDSFGEKNLTRIKPYVLVERELLFGLDWQVQTIVTRLAPARDNLQVRIPLLPNESVLSDNIELDGNNVIVSLNTNVNRFSWQSQLPRTDSLELKVSDAAKDNWQEKWGLTMGHLWNVQTSGTPEIKSAISTHSRNPEFERHPVFMPRVGESLAIKVSRPAATSGATLAIENVTNTMIVGKRLSNNTITFKYRSSQGGQHVLELPEKAKLSSVSIDGRENFVQLEGRSLPLSLLPGEHEVKINWSEETPITSRHRNSEFKLGHLASNVRTNLQLPRDRWLLFASSERLGPAILYWPRLFVLLLLAVALGKFAKTPLRWYDWVFLGLGFSTISWFSYLAFAAWLLAIAYRNQFVQVTSKRVYNLSQLALVALTFFAAMALLYSLPTGLLGQPKMSVQGFQSTAFNLNWYHDSINDLLPQVYAFSVPMWIYKLIILLWALWLSFALMRWLPWAWKQFSEQAIWIKSPKSKKPTSTATELKE